MKTNIDGTDFIFEVNGYNPVEEFSRENCKVKITVKSFYFNYKKEEELPNYAVSNIKRGIEDLIKNDSKLESYTQIAGDFTTDFNIQRNFPEPWMVLKIGIPNAYGQEYVISFDEPDILRFLAYFKEICN